MNQSTRPGLSRHIGLIGLTAYGVGTILGAGIYALIGEAAALAGNGLWLSFLFGAAIAALTGLSYAELATMFPRAGAEFEFVWQAFGKKWLAFLVGWVLVLSTTASASTVALGFAEYLHALTGSAVVGTALLLLFFLSVISFVGIRESTSVNVVFTLIEAGGLVWLIATAIGTTGRIRPTTVPNDWTGIFEATALILFAYLGFEDIANAAEETIAPERTIPVAILLSIVLTAILYVGVALASLALVSPDRLAASSAPLAYALATVWGPAGSEVLSVIALFATANTVLLLLVAGTRMLYGMAHSGALPAILAHVHPSTRTPDAATAAQGLASIALLPLGGIVILGTLASWSALIAFVAVNAALLWLRRTRPTLRRPFRVPLNLGWLSLPALIGLVTAFVTSLRVAPEVILFGSVVTMLGIPIYLACRRA